MTVSFSYVLPVSERVNVVNFLGVVLSSLTVRGRSSRSTGPPSSTAHLVSLLNVGLASVAFLPPLPSTSRHDRRKLYVGTKGLLGQLLTGKAPTHVVLHDEGAEEEMVEMLRLAMECTVPTPDQRPARADHVSSSSAPWRQMSCAIPTE